MFRSGSSGMDGMPSGDYAAEDQGLPIRSGKPPLVEAILAMRIPRRAPSGQCMPVPGHFTPRLVASIIPRRAPSGQRDYSNAGLPPGVTVRLVSNGGVNPQMEAVQPHSTFKPFDPRLNSSEVEVLQWLADGKTRDDITKLLCVTSNAVYQRLHRIYDKLGVNTAAGAVGRGLRRNIIK